MKATLKEFLILTEQDQIKLLQRLYRELHSVRGVSRGLLEVRNYTCTCLTCLNHGHGSCVNDANIESWGICDIVVQKKKDQKMTKADEKKKPKDKEKMKRSSTKKKRDVVNKL